MEGVPTLWNVSDLETKRLSKARREFLMLVVGVVEMKAEGKNSQGGRRHFSPRSCQEDGGKVNEGSEERDGERC